MNTKLIFTSAFVAAALSVSALPAGAQARSNAGSQRTGERAVAGQARARGESAREGRSEQASRNEPAQQAPRSEHVQQAPRDDRGQQARDEGERQQRAVPLAEGRPSYQAPASRDDRDRRDDRYRQDGRDRDDRYRQDGRDRDDRYRQDGRDRDDRYRQDGRDRDGRYSQDGRYQRDDRGPRVGPRTYSYRVRPYVSRRYVRPYNYVPYRPYRFGRPYYSFRPRLSIGFGLWIGNTVPYPWAYLGTYRPRVYGSYPYTYGPSAAVSIYGGVSFDLQPSDADLFVDGEYVGQVGDFGPYAEPLTLTPGDHTIAVQRDGYRPMEWDVTIQPGQVVPYQGEMQPF